MRMISTDVTAAAEGLEDRTFACMKCGHVETKRMAADPLISPAATGWTEGSLKRPQ